MMRPWTVLVAVAIAASASPSAGAEREQPVINRCAAHIPEAARRSGVSENVVMRVMVAESAGKSRIVSAKGAMGCMQIMPATWAYLTARYNLGIDPFDVRMNMIGGAMYLAELAARYGWPGAFSAYNAGPGRYERYARGGVPLPAETIAYTARLGGNANARSTVALPPRWQEAQLFFARPTGEGMAVLPSMPTLSRRTAEMGSRNSLFALPERSDADAAVNAGP